MTTTDQTCGSINENEPTVSSPLLASTNPVSNYSSAVSRQPVTDTGGIIREVWYNTLRSTFLLEWMNIRESFDGSWRSKLKATLKCFCLPCYVLKHALDGQRRYSRQNGIMYLYVFVYLGVAVIVNLNSPMSVKDRINQPFLISCMVAIILMWHLLQNVYRTATFPSSNSTLLRIFYETGLFVFGFSTVGYSIATAVMHSSHRLNAVASGVKALFTFLQIIFFYCFYRARIPKDTRHIEIILAHLFGTNLALWFCTLYAEWNPEECTEEEKVKKYFTPLSVEFLLLAASLCYQIWKDLQSEDTISLSPQHMCTECQRILYRNLVANNDGDSQSVDSYGARSGLRTRHPGTIIGGCFAALFIVSGILAKSSYPFKVFYILMYFCIIILYLVQIWACYICQVSLQFHQRDTERFPLDHEDILLYFSLAGVLLWNGYEIYGVIQFPGLFTLAVTDILAILQQLFQTATLVKLRFHRHIPSQSQVWIRECLSFLLVTNLTLWFQESFFIELVDILAPSSEGCLLYVRYPFFIYLVHPLSIFYRFHSSVCCVLAWTQ